MKWQSRMYRMYIVILSVSKEEIHTFHIHKISLEDNIIWLHQKEIS